MTFQSSISVTLVKSGTTAVDLASRTMGVRIEQRLDIGRLGRHTAQITLNNNDGALTPGAGGTYGDVDWFARAIKIDGDTGTYTYNLCHGLITKFDLDDDSRNSYVTLTIDDVFTCGGNASVSMQKSSSAIATTLRYWLEALMNGTVTSGAAFNRVRLPALGGSTRAIAVTDVGLASGRNLSYDVSAFPSSTYATVANDFISQSLMPAGPNVAWPTTIDETQTYAYEAAVCQLYPLRNTSTAITFTFTEDAASGELPVNDVKRGYTIDQLINDVSMTALHDGTATQPHTVETTNTDSLDAFGQRGMSASAIMETSTSGYTSLEAIAGRWANQYSQPEFVVREFAVDELTVNHKVGGFAPSEQKWAQLLDVSTGICQVARLSFTPTGAGSPLTEDVVMLSRVIELTKNNVRLRVQCLPLAQAGGFTLNSATLGVLDTNRLG